MNRTLARRDPIHYLPFEKWPDEDTETYAIFLGYCKSPEGMLPTDYLLAAGHPEYLSEAIFRGWMQRKDAYQKWMDSQRRQKVLNLLEEHLVAIRNRLPYLQQREEWARKREAEILSIKNPNPKATLSSLYERAIKETNQSIELLLEVVEALEPSSGINIQNIVAGMPSPVADKIVTMQKTWGEPDATQDESAEPPQ